MSRILPRAALAICVAGCGQILGLDDPVDRWLPELANRRASSKRLPAMPLLQHLGQMKAHDLPID